MWQFPADLVTYIEDILIGKLQFLWSNGWLWHIQINGQQSNCEMKKEFICKRFFHKSISPAVGTL